MLVDKLKMSGETKRTLEKARYGLGTNYCLCVRTRIAFLASCQVTSYSNDRATFCRAEGVSFLGSLAIRLY